MTAERYIPGEHPTWRVRCAARLKHLATADLLLAVVVLLPPLVHVSPSRRFNVVVSLLELVFVVFIAIRHRGRFFDLQGRARRLLWVAAAFLTWMIITAALAEYGSFAARRTFNVSIHLVFGYAVWRYLQLRAGSADWAARLVTLSFVVPAVGLVVFALRLDNPLGYDWLDPPFYSNIRHLGYHASASTVFAGLLLTLTRRGTWQQALAATWLVANLVVLFWAGGRSSLSSLAIAALVMLWAVGTPSRRTLIMAIGCLFSAAVLVALLNLEWLSAAMLERTLNADDLNALLSKRLMIWHESLASMHNWWTGIGGDNFIRLDIARRLHITQAHSVVVQSLLDWGILGMLAFCSAVVAIVVAALRRLRAAPANRLQIAVAALLVAYLAQSLVDGIFFHGLPFMLFVLCAALTFRPPDTERPAQG